MLLITLLADVESTPLFQSSSRNGDCLHAKPYQERPESIACFLTLIQSPVSLSDMECCYQVGILALVSFAVPNKSYNKSAFTPALIIVTIQNTSLPLKTRNIIPREIKKTTANYIWICTCLIKL